MNKASGTKNELRLALESHEHDWSMTRLINKLSQADHSCICTNIQTYDRVCFLNVASITTQKFILRAEPIEMNERKAQLKEKHIHT